MERRRFLGLIVGGFLAAPLAVKAQQRARVPRIGVLSAISLYDPEVKPYLTAFREGLRELGLVEGQSIAIEYRSAEGKYDRLPELATELVGLKLDVIVASGGPPVVRAAHRASSTIPIVMTAVGDPVGAGLVASLARPGGNITGLAIVASELAGKRLELLTTVVPKVSVVAILWNPANPSGEVREADTAARNLGVQLYPVMAQTPRAIDEAFLTMTRKHVDAVLVVSDSMFITERERIAEFAAKTRLPAVYGNRLHVEAGGLIGYGADLLDVARRIARYVDRILKGARPADLPVEQARKFELVINLKTAKALGLTIPPSLLQRADQVIE